jgi:hypothetical protein
MSTDQSLSQVNIFGLFGEAARSVAQSDLKTLALAPALAIIGFIAADALAFMLREMFFIRLIQWLLKIVIALCAGYATVYLMRRASLANEPVTLKALLLELKSKLSRILKTLGAVLNRFKGPAVLVIISSLLANLTRTPEILLVILPVFGIWALYLFVRYVFFVYLIFDPDLKPSDIPARSEELAKGRSWRIFFTLFFCGLLISIAFAPLFLLYWGTQEVDGISALGDFVVDVFRGPALFVILYYVIYAGAVVFQTVVFMKFYDRIIESSKQQKLSEERSA